MADYIMRHASCLGACQPSDLDMTRIWQTTSSVVIVSGTGPPSDLDTVYYHTVLQQQNRG